MPYLAKNIYYLLLASTSLAGLIVADKKHTSPANEILRSNDCIFSGNEIRDSKICNGKVTKATGGEVAWVHDDILRKFGLVSENVPELEKIVVKIKPDGSNPDEYLTDIVGQMREEQNVEILGKYQRYGYVEENWQSFLKASMLGVGITDLIYNPNNIVILNNQITVIDVDSMSLPIIPYKEFSKLFGIEKDDIKIEAKKFFESSEYSELMTKKLELIEKCSGKDSPIYLQYKKSFDDIGRHIVDQESYTQTGFYFGNIREVKIDDKGKLSFKANFSPIYKEAANLQDEFPKTFSNPSITPLLCRVYPVLNTNNSHREL